MSRPRKIVFNAAANWAGFVAQLLVAFVAAPILIDRLGRSRYGVWSLAESVLAYLTLFDLGVASSIVRYVAKFDACADRRSLNRVFSTSLAIFVATGLIVLVLAGGIAALWARPLHLPPEMASEFRWLLVILAINLAVGFPLGLFPSILDGMEQYPAKTAIRTTTLLVRSAWTIVAVSRGHGLVTIGLITTGVNLVEHALLGYWAFRVVPYLRFSRSDIDRETFRMIRGYSIYSFLTMIAGRISFQTDSIVIGAFLAPEYITFFVMAARLVEYAKSAFRSVTTVLTPVISGLEARGDGTAIRSIWVGGTRYVLLLVLPVQMGLLLLGRSFLGLWLGPDFAHASSPTLLILAIPLGLTVAQSLSGRVLYGVGQLRGFTLISSCEAICNLLMSLLLVRPFGIAGVAIGTAVPNIASCIAITVLVCRTTQVGFIDYLRLSWIRPLLLSLVPSATWIVGARLLPPDTWPRLLLLGSLGICIYAAVVLHLEFPGFVHKALSGFRKATWPARSDESDQPRIANPEEG